MKGAPFWLKFDIQKGKGSRLWAEHPRKVQGLVATNISFVQIDAVENVTTIAFKHYQASFKQIFRIQNYFLVLSL